MIPGSIEIVTAITIILIVGILAVYLSILKKYGWIGESQNYRCPNPQCQKIFQTPMKVKDFSNKKAVGLACPECGYDLGSFDGKKGLKENALQSKPEIKIQDSTPKPIETEVSTTNYGNKEPEASRTAAPIVELKKNESSPEIDNSCLKQKLDNHKKDGPACCNHYFGYLGGIPKHAETLNECYFCPRLIECCEKASN